jgi:hypothetical protein
MKRHNKTEHENIVASPPTTYLDTTYLDVKV